MLKTKQSQQSKNMLHGLVVTTQPLSGNEDNSDGKRISLEDTMLSNGSAVRRNSSRKPPTIAEERDPEMDHRSTQDHKDDVESVKKHKKRGGIFNKILHPKHRFASRHEDDEEDVVGDEYETGLKEETEEHHAMKKTSSSSPRSVTSATLPSALTIKRDKTPPKQALSWRGIATIHKPLEERVELVAMQDPKTGKPFIRILMSKNAAGGSGGGITKTKYATKKHTNKKEKELPPPPTKKNSPKIIQRKIQKSLSWKALSQKSLNTAGTVPAVVRVPSTDCVVDASAVGVVGGAAAAPAVVASHRNHDIEEPTPTQNHDKSRSSLSQKRFSAKGLFSRRSNKNVATSEDPTTSPKLVATGYEPSEDNEEPSQNQQRPFKMKRSSSKRALMAGAAMATTAAAAVYAAASTRRTLNLKKKKEKEELSIQKETSRKKKNYEMKFAKLLQDTEVLQRDLPPQE